MTRVISVSRQQIEAAKAVIMIAGGPEKVDPLIVKIAEAKPRRRESTTGQSA
jgi:DNA-binding transcriptional regulator LsrR (DeoR family)